MKEEKIREGVALICNTLKEQGEAFRMLVLPDHPTPLSLRTHVSDPVPFILYKNTGCAGPHGERYTEAAAKNTGLYLSEGPMMIKKLISGDF